MTNFILFVSQDLSSVIKKTATFLNKKFDDEHVNKLIDHLSFANMKNNPAVNKIYIVKKLHEMKAFGDKKPEGNFIRNGSVGQWKESMPENMIKRFDDWIAANTKDTDYKI